jgi:hypothetical protein
MRRIASGGTARDENEQKDYFTPAATLLDPRNG